ncbi:uncharacterized protein soul5l [Aplochiton taeniatus]
MDSFGTRTMAVFIGLAALTIMVTAEGSVGPSSNTSFCTESKECLEYELVCKTDEYEVRHYSPTRWVSTDAEAYFMGVGAAMAFRRLFQYLTGANEGGVQMEMTAPVLVKIPEETRMWEPAIYTLNFLLPAAYQDSPPTPTNEKLYFTDMPDMDVYVRSYGGWMLSVTSRLHAHLLTKELGRVRADYNHSYHYGVGYDSPLKLLNRHNEVWYVSEGPAVCTDPQEPTPAHTHTPTPTETASDPTTHTPSDSPTHPPADFLTNTPTEAPAHALFGSPSSHTPSLSPAGVPSDTVSDPPSDSTSSGGPTPTHRPVGPLANTSEPLATLRSAVPPLDLQSDVNVWNNTGNGSPETQAENSTASEVAPAITP